MWVEMEVLTPTHIGNGNEINPMEYWIHDGLARINMESLFRDPHFLPHQETFIQGAVTRRYLGQYLSGELLSRHTLYEAPISPGAREYMVHNQTVVKEHIKSAGRAFVPGSSIKGSLLSAMIWHVLQELYGRASDRATIDELLRQPRDHRSFRRILDLAIGALNGKRVPGARVDSFFNWLQVSDSNPALPESSLCVFFSQVIGAKRGGNLPILFEGLANETKWRFSVTSSRDSRFDVTSILQIADRFYRLIWERSGFSKTPPEGRHLLRLGQGSSAWSTSLLLFAENVGASHYAVRPPRTRKLVDGEIPMGWVLLSPTETVLSKDQIPTSRPIPSIPRSTGVEIPEKDKHPRRQEPADRSAPGEAHQVKKTKAMVDRATSDPRRPVPVRKAVAPALQRDRKVEGLLAQVSAMPPQDKLMLERIVSGLDYLEEAEASRVAVALREKLTAAGLWGKHPKRFEIEVFILE